MESTDPVVRFDVLKAVKILGGYKCFGVIIASIFRAELILKMAEICSSKILISKNHNIIYGFNILDLF